MKCANLSTLPTQLVDKWCPKSLDFQGFLCYSLLIDATTGIAELESKIEKLELLVAEQALTIAKRDELIKYYLEQLRLAKRRQFGASSERIDSDEFRQQTLDNVLNEAEIEADITLPEPQIVEITYKRKKQQGKREKDLFGLPVVRIEHELPEDQRYCEECGKPFDDIGVTVWRELEIVPAHVVIKEHAVHAYKKHDHTNDHAENHNTEGQLFNMNVQPAIGEETDGQAETQAAAVAVDAILDEDIPEEKAVIVRAEAPKPLISGSLASPSAVAYIVNQKYTNGMPLYRVEQDLKLNGVNLSRQTMSNWIIYCTQNFLNALYILLITIMLTESVLHADETTQQVLHEPGKSATSKSYEWIYSTSGCAAHPIVIYDYKDSRDGKHVKGFLKDFNGFLHTDGYQGYHDLPPGIIIVGCWAHYPSRNNIRARNAA